MKKEISPNTIPMSEITSELERLFSFFNLKIFDGKLPSVMITIQRAGRKPFLGWFWEGVWISDSKSICEINLSAEWLFRPVEEILNTLIHEMVHLENAIAGIKDCSKAQYHNGKFKVAAERATLKVERYKRLGWAVTSNTPETLKIIQAAKPNHKTFLAVSQVPNAAASGKKKGSKLKKWFCGCTNIRVAVSEFSATCNLCENKFQCAEGDSEESESEE